MIKKGKTNKSKLAFLAIGIASTLLGCDREILDVPAIVFKANPKTVNIVEDQTVQITLNWETEEPNQIAGWSSTSPGVAQNFSIR